MTKDPVCGMEVDEAKACKATFDKDPAKYVGKQDKRPGAPHH